jgi:predicted ATPase/DNA-binding CsgD family transcriptional regulator
MMGTVTPQGSVRISQRETEVLALLRSRLTNAQIAHRLSLSVRTVENHVSSLLRKYQVANRRALAAIAAQAPSGAPAPHVVSGLPAPRTSFVGRAHERDAILAMLKAARLVTLVGSGGVGKTRLAATVAGAVAEHAAIDGAFVDLVPVRDEFIAQAVAAAIGVTERSRKPLVDSVIDRLGENRWLLVLDNCEHVLDAVAAFAERVLSACPATTVLATSRERLGLPGERVVPVAPLPLAADAEALFVDRAVAADPEFVVDPAAVARICARLDGMPLAIELAAARVGALGTGGLLAALDDQVSLLTGSRDPDERHRSMVAVIDWSHRLLDDEERAAFRRLAVFVGGFDIDAAVAVYPGTGRGRVAHLLGRLADRSLIMRDPPRPHWRYLDTIRAVALEHLAASGEQSETHQRYLRWAAATAAGLEHRLNADLPAAFDAVADDLRAALGHAAPGAGPGHALARSLGHLSYARRFLSEAVAHYRYAAGLAATPAEAAADLRTAAQATFMVGLAAGAFDLLLASAERARAGGDGNGEAVGLAQAVVTGARFTSGFPRAVPASRLAELLDRALRAGDRRDPQVAAQIAAARAWTADLDGVTSPEAPADRVTAALTAARRTGDPVLISTGLDAATEAALRAGRLRDAYRIARERLALLASMDRDHPYPAAEILDTFHRVWLGALATGDLPTALSTARAIRADDLLGAHAYRPASKLIPPLVLTGAFDEAIGLGPAMWAQWRHSGAPIAAWLSCAASALALAHGLLGDDSRYRQWRARAAQALGMDNPALAGRQGGFAIFVDARVAVHTGVGADPSSLVARAFEVPVGSWSATYARAAAAELAIVAGLPDAADRLADAAAAEQENAWAAACLARARGRQGDPDAHADAIRRWERIGARFERACTTDSSPLHGQGR